MKAFTTPSDAQMSMHTEIGGLLRFENVQPNPKADDRYKCSWINTWQKKVDDPDLEMHFDQQVKLVMTKAMTSTGYPIVRAYAFENGAEKVAGSFDDVIVALADAFKTKGAAMIIDMSDGYNELPVFLPGEKKDGKYIHADADEYAKSIFGNLSDDVRAKYDAVAAEGKLIVLPCDSLSVGGKTAEALVSKMEDAEKSGKDARVMSVNPNAYDTRPMGRRVEAALHYKANNELIIPEEDAKRLAQAFDAWAPKDVQAAFAKDGWKAISNADVKRFFESQGVELKEHPSMGYNTAQLKLQKFKGGDAFFLAASLEATQFAQPYPRIEATKELRSEYNDEMVKAATAVIDQILDRKAENDAAKPDADVPLAEESEEEKEARMAEVDDLLDAELSMGE